MGSIVNTAPHHSICAKGKVVYLPAFVILLRGMTIPLQVMKSSLSCTKLRAQLPAALPSVPLDPKFASDFGPSMRSKLLVAHVHSLEATFQAYAVPVQGTPLAMSDLLCPLDFLCQVACSSAAPALNNVSLVLGRLCNQSPWSLEVGTVVAVLPEKPTLHENFWLAYN